jgi:hypothetical protein
MESIVLSEPLQSVYLVLSNFKESNDICVLLPHMTDHVFQIVVADQEVPGVDFQPIGRRVISEQRKGSPRLDHNKKVSPWHSAQPKSDHPTPCHAGIQNFS